MYSINIARGEAELSSVHEEDKRADECGGDHDLASRKGAYGFLITHGSVNMRVATHVYLARAARGLLELHANVEAPHRRRWADVVARRGGDVRVSAACAGRRCGCPRSEGTLLELLRDIVAVH